MKQRHSHRSEWPRVPSQLFGEGLRHQRRSARLREALQHLAELVTLNEQERRQVLAVYSAVLWKLLFLALVGLGVRFFEG